jgi:tetratricopeptide (TPR) repeat protein
MGSTGIPENYIPILLFIGIAAIGGGGALLVGSLMRPSRPYRAKLAPYESGSPLFSDARAFVQIGVTYELERKYDEARASYEAATRAAPDDAYPWRILGARLLRWDQGAEALVPLERAVALDPESRESWHAFAVALYRTGDAERAEETFRRALTRFPNDLDLLLGKAALLVNARRFDEALGVYDRVIVLASKAIGRPATCDGGICCGGFRTRPP